MRKVVVAVLLVVPCFPLLAACGAPGSASSPPATSTPAAARPSAAATNVPSAVETGAGPAAASAAATTPATPGSTAADATSGRDIRVALVTSGGRVDGGGIEQLVYEGLQRAQQELGVSIDYVEPGQPTEIETNLERFASGDYDLVIGVGFEMGDSMQAVAREHPDTQFAIVDFASDAPLGNLKVLLFAEDQAGYIVGTMAALVSQSNTIGVVGGVQIPPVERFVKGYEAGAKAQKPDINVLSVYLPTFGDPAAGAEAARSQIAAGADVIFGAGGPTGSGAIAAAAKDDTFVIGVDQDEYTTTFRGGAAPGADKILTSALKRFDNAVFQVVHDVVHGTFTSELYRGTVENGGVDYAKAHDASAAITPEIKARVDEVKQGLADGSITTGVE